MNLLSSPFLCVDCSSRHAIFARVRFFYPLDPNFLAGSLKTSLKLAVIIDYSASPYPVAPRLDLVPQFHELIQPLF